MAEAAAGQQTGAPGTAAPARDAAAAARGQAATVTVGAACGRPAGHAVSVIMIKFNDSELTSITDDDDNAARRQQAQPRLRIIIC